MQVMRDFMVGVLSVMKITGAPMLYRYPYRTSAEAMRADWQHISNDIKSMMGNLEAEQRDE